MTVFFRMSDIQLVDRVMSIGNDQQQKIFYSNEWLCNFNNHLVDDHNYQKYVLKRDSYIVFILGIADVFKKQINCNYLNIFSISTSNQKLSANIILLFLKYNRSIKQIQDTAHYCNFSLLEKELFLLDKNPIFTNNGLLQISYITQNTLDEKLYIEFPNIKLLIYNFPKQKSIKEIIEWCIQNSDITNIYKKQLILLLNYEISCKINITKTALQNAVLLFNVNQTQLIEFVPFFMPKDLIDIIYNYLFDTKSNRKLFNEKVYGDLTIICNPIFNDDPLNNIKLENYMIMDDIKSGQIFFNVGIKDCALKKKFYYNKDQNIRDDFFDPVNFPIDVNYAKVQELTFSIEQYHIQWNFITTDQYNLEECCLFNALGKPLWDFFMNNARFLINKNARIGIKYKKQKFILFKICDSQFSLENDFKNMMLKLSFYKRLYSNLCVNEILQFLKNSPYIKLTPSANLPNINLKKRKLRNSGQIDYYLDLLFAD